MEQRRRRLGPPEITFHGRPVFYGWWVVTAGSLLSTLVGGFYIHGFAAFLGPLAKEFDVGYATATLVFTAAAGSEAVLGPLIGYLVDRFGSRRVMLAGIPLFAAGFFLLSIAPSLLVVFIAVAAVISPGVNMGVFASTATAVSHWFHRRRAVALSIATVGFGVGGLLVSFLQYFIDAYDWRVAARAAAVVIIAVGFPRRAPSDAQPPRRRRASPRRRTTPGRTARHARRHADRRPHSS